MRVRVLFFAASREAAGTAQQEVELPEAATTETLVAALIAAHPRLAGIMGSSVLALNQEYVARGQAPPALREGDEVAIIPPLSGG
jgi:molybdopterin synthase catalytic subunit